MNVLLNSKRRSDDNKFYKDPLNVDKLVLDAWDQSSDRQKDITVKNKNLPFPLNLSKFARILERNNSNVQLALLNNSSSIRVDSEDSFERYNKQKRAELPVAILG
jgi:hypothetical protein